MANFNDVFHEMLLSLTSARQKKDACPEQATKSKGSQWGGQTEQLGTTINKLLWGQHLLENQMHPVSRETETVFTANDETDFRRTQKRGDYVTFSFFYGCSITFITIFNFTNFEKLQKIWIFFATLNSFLKPYFQKRRGKYKQICMYIHTYTTYVNMHTYICRRRTFKKEFFKQ